MRQILAVIAIGGAVALHVGQSPMDRVTGKLKQMNKEMAAEQKADDEAFNKYNCWANSLVKKTKNDIVNEKNAAEEFRTQSNKNKAEAMKSSVESGQLKQDIDRMTKQAAADKASRESEYDAFNEDLTDTQASMNALKGALTMLKRTLGGSALIQMPDLKPVVEKALLACGKKLDADQKAKLDSFIQGKGAADEIFGILQTMMDNFKSDAAEMKAKEGDKSSNFQESQANLQSSIEDSSDAKSNADANAEEKTELANTQDNAFKKSSNLVATMQQTVADTLSEQQSMRDAYDTRSHDRAVQVNAVNKAIAILNSETAMKQRNAAGSSNTALISAQKVMSLLQETSSPRLNLLSVFKTTTFKEVQEKLKTHQADLKKQAKDERERREKCYNKYKKIKEELFNFNNERKIASHEKANNEETAATSTASMQEAQAEKAETRENLKIAAENRNRGHPEFNTAVADQEAIQNTMRNAKIVLEDEFKTDVASSQLMQQAGHASALFAGLQEKPEGFKEFDAKNAGGFAVIKIINDEIKQSEHDVEDMTTSENILQQKHEESVRSMNKQIKDSGDVVTSSRKNLGEAKEGAATQGQKFLDNDRNYSLAEKRQALAEKQCGFLMEHFEARQDAFSREMQAVQQARELLS